LTLPTLARYVAGVNSESQPVGPVSNSRDTTIGITSKPPTSSPAQQGDDSNEKAKVDRLLERIAAQSHFEERYETSGSLAEGGMGKILKAYDRILHRDVAIKMMKDEFPAAREREAVRGQFLKDARVGGRLLHPNLLAVFDLGVNLEKRIYFTMRLVDGASLQNCMEGLVFVIDWGLARVDDIDDTERLLDLYQGSGTPETVSTVAVGGGRTLGTPAYMAPEQARGDMDKLDEATDVYGLGGILHYILYGVPPNQLERGKLRAEILPHGRRVHKQELTAIENLQKICRKALELDRGKRFESVEALIIDLNEWLSNTPADWA
jgi:serine/threonine protein kinase